MVIVPATFQSLPLRLKLCRRRFMATPYRARRGAPNEGMVENLFGICGYDSGYNSGYNRSYDSACGSGQS